MVRTASEQVKELAHTLEVRAANLRKIASLVELAEKGKLKDDPKDVMGWLETFEDFCDPSNRICTDITKAIESVEKLLWP